MRISMHKVIKVRMRAFLYMPRTRTEAYASKNRQNSKKFFEVSDEPTKNQNSNQKRYT